jgi:protein-S-isoprenylcysteine O-methyltransferase Ste14
MFRLLVFVIVTVGLTAYSFPYLRDRRSHGFFRYFAWEAVLGLVLLNIEYWLENPFSPRQVFSWIFLVVSLYMVIEGVRLMRAVGRPEGRLENTTELVSIGLFRYIRHPLYSSLLFLAWGAFLKNVSLVSGVVVLAATLLLFATAKVEEDEDLSKFGARYAEYMKKTTRFVPFLV